MIRNFPSEDPPNAFSKPMCVFTHRVCRAKHALEFESSMHGGQRLWIAGGSDKSWNGINLCGVQVFRVL